jgi:hypothetical protein
MPVSQASAPPILRTRRAGLVGRAVGAASAVLIADELFRFFCSAHPMPHQSSYPQSPLWPWIEQASKRLHGNMLAIALANKLARIAWAVLARGREYQPMIMARTS